MGAGMVPVLIALTPSLETIMATRTLRLPKRRLLEASKSPAVRQAGIKVGPSPIPTAFGDSTEWQSVKVETPSALSHVSDAYLVGLLATLCIGERK